MPSSVVRDYRYDDRHAVLRVTLVSGRRYEYFGVPRSVYAGLHAAESKGRFYNLTIKPRFPFRRIEPDA